MNGTVHVKPSGRSVIDGPSIRSNTERISSHRQPQRAMVSVVDADYRKPLGHFTATVFSIVEWGHYCHDSLRPVDLLPLSLESMADLMSVVLFATMFWLGLLQGRVVARASTVASGSLVVQVLAGGVIFGLRGSISMVFEVSVTAMSQCSLTRITSTSLTTKNWGLILIGHAAIIVAFLSSLHFLAAAHVPKLDVWNAFLCAKGMLPVGKGNRGVRCLERGDELSPLDITPSPASRSWQQKLYSSGHGWSRSARWKFQLRSRRCPGLHGWNLQEGIGLRAFAEDRTMHRAILRCRYFGRPSH